MAKQTIGIGTSANDGTGDPLRDAFDKVNDNFDEVYADDFITNARLADDAVDTAQIADDAITHALLENRYTATGSITTYASAVSVNWANATNYVMGGDITGNIEFDFTGFKTGQVLTIHKLSGSYSITLDSDAATSETFNKVGANDYDGASDNVLIVECIDDGDDAIFNYSILTYVSDPTP